MITLAISSSEMDMGEEPFAEYEAVGISVRSAFGMGGKNGDFKASAFSGGVVAMPEGITRLGMVWGYGEDGFFHLPILPVARFPFFPLQHQPQLA